MFVDLGSDFQNAAGNVASAIPQASGFMGGMACRWRNTGDDKNQNGMRDWCYHLATELHSQWT
jgi:hypothetical protein